MALASGSRRSNICVAVNASCFRICHPIIRLTPDDVGQMVADGEAELKLTAGGRQNVYSSTVASSGYASDIYTRDLAGNPGLYSSLPVLPG
jgi:hypothetical protein